MENHDLIDPVDKFRLKQPFYLFHDAGLHFLIILFFIRMGGKAQVLRIDDALRPCIGGHDKHGILKAYLPALGIRNMPVIQHLKQDIEYVRMRFFHFIEKHHGIRIAPHLLRQLAAVVKANISRRGTDQLGNGMSLHIF